jgi:predicted nucleic acid-binding protein
MIAVADTSPICYLVLIGQIDILSKLFSRVVVSPAVLAELLHDDAPEAVRDWAGNLPSWISVEENIIGTTVGMEKLQAGEQSAILLAEPVKADMILLDEKAARRVAADRGLRVTGTLGVLGEAAARRLVDLPTAIDRLRRTNFRYSPVVMKAALDRFGQAPDRS